MDGIANTQPVMRTVRRFAKGEMRLFTLLVLAVFVAFGIWLTVSGSSSGWSIAATGFFGLCLLVAILEPWLPKPHVSGKSKNEARRTTNLAEVVERLRVRADTPLILCSSTSPDLKTVWVWALEENATNRLRTRWSGVLRPSEFDELAGMLRQHRSVWIAGIDTCHPPPSGWFRMVYTFPPAPCRIYTRRGLMAAVEPTAATRYLPRLKQIAVRSSSVVEGWISHDWIHAGISLVGDAGAREEFVRLKNAGLFNQFLLMYDGIDLMMDTGWLDRVVPRVAEVLGLEWRVVDYRETPPKVERQSGDR